MDVPFSSSMSCRSSLSQGVSTPKLRYHDLLVQGLAYAKINLTLEVTGKRLDGFHELRSIMQTVSLADELTLEPDGEPSLECNVPELAGDGNLVLRAARLLGIGGRFVLRKRIPTAAGLAGGSSDAALALRLLDAVYRLGLPPERLLEAAAQLGSDVPYFLHGGTALVEGRGERVTPLPDLQECRLVLLNPGRPLSTAAVFRELLPREYAASRAGAAPAGVPPLVNTLEAPALRLEPAIADCRRVLVEAGVAQVLLSGSGPTLFGLVDGREEAERVARQTGAVPARFVPRAEALAMWP